MPLLTPHLLFFLFNPCKSNTTGAATATVLDAADTERRAMQVSADDETTMADKVGLECRWFWASDRDLLFFLALKASVCTCKHPVQPLATCETRTLARSHQQIKKMGIAMPALPATGSRKGVVASSVAQMLAQALHSGDEALLEEVGASWTVSHQPSIPLAMVALALFF